MIIFDVVEDRDVAHIDFDDGDPHFYRILQHVVNINMGSETYSATDDLNDPRNSNYLIAFKSKSRKNTNEELTFAESRVVKCCVRDRVFYARYFHAAKAN